MNILRITAAAILSIFAIGAEAAQADKANHQLSYGELGYPVQIASGTSPSRAQIVAEFEQAQAKGQVSTGELGVFPVVSGKSDFIVTSAQVHAELEQAKANGQLSSGELNYGSTAI